MSFLPINIREIDNPVKLIADDWGLLSAGTADNWNTMTVSWGGVGELWHRGGVVFAFVRPQRYTYKFMEEQEMFTLSFGLNREITTLCGKVSGRDRDKIKEAGLTTHTQDNAVWPAEAELVLVCRKIAAQDMDPAGFIDPTIEDNYDGDYHRMYVGEVVQVYKKV